MYANFGLILEAVVKTDCLLQHDDIYFIKVFILDPITGKWPIPHLTTYARILYRCGSGFSHLRIPLGA